MDLSEARRRDTSTERPRPREARSFRVIDGSNRVRRMESVHNSDAERSEGPLRDGGLAVLGHEWFDHDRLGKLDDAGDE